MPIWKQRLLARYHDEAGEHGSDNGGTGTGTGSGGASDDKGGTDDNKGTDDKGGGGTDDKGTKKPSLTDKEAELLKENMKKKEALQNAQKALDAANARLKDFEGIDAAEVKKLLQERKDAETRALEAKGEWDRLKERIVSEHQNETKALKDRIAALEGEVGQKVSMIDELTIGAAFAQSKFLPEDTVYTPAKARKVYGDHFELQDGQVVAYDKPKGAANRTMLVNGLGQPVPFDEAMRKIVEADPEKDEILRSKVKQGSGSGSGSKPAQRQEKPATDSVSKIGAGLAALKL